MLSLQSVLRNGVSLAYVGSIQNLMDPKDLPYPGVCVCVNLFDLTQMPLEDTLQPVLPQSFCTEGPVVIRKEARSFLHDKVRSLPMLGALRTFRT